MPALRGLRLRRPRRLRHPQPSTMRPRAVGPCAGGPARSPTVEEDIPRRQFSPGHGRTTLPEQPSNHRKRSGETRRGAFRGAVSVARSEPRSVEGTEIGREGAPSTTTAHRHRSRGSSREPRSALPRARRSSRTHLDRPHPVRESLPGIFPPTAAASQWAAAEPFAGRCRRPNGSEAPDRHLHRIEGTPREPSARRPPMCVSSERAPLPRRVEVGRSRLAKVLGSTERRAYLVGARSFTCAEAPRDRAGWPGAPRPGPGRGVAEARAEVRRVGPSGRAPPRSRAADHAPR